MPICQKFIDFYWYLFLTEKSSDAHVRFFDSNETTPEVTINTDGEQ